MFCVRWRHFGVCARFSCFRFLWVFFLFRPGAKRGGAGRVWGKFPHTIVNPTLKSREREKTKCLRIWTQSEEYTKIKGGNKSGWWIFEKVQCIKFGGLAEALSRGRILVDCWRWWRRWRRRTRTGCWSCPWRTSCGSRSPWSLICSWLRTGPGCRPPLRRTLAHLQQFPVCFGFKLIRLFGVGREMIFHLCTLGSRWSEEIFWFSLQRDPFCWGRGWWTCPWTICCCKSSQTVSNSLAFDSVGNQFDSLFFFFNSNNKLIES